MGYSRAPIAESASPQAPVWRSYKERRSDWLQHDGNMVHEDAAGNTHYCFGKSEIIVRGVS